MAAQSTPPASINYQELAGILEPLIRRVVREELIQVATRRPDIFYLQPDSPLHDDMVEILDRHREGTTKLYSRSEVWDE